MTRAPRQVLSGLSVLLVEDETAVSFLLEDMLRDLGAASIRLAADVDAALSLLAGPFRPALSVMDVNLGGELVYPVAERLDAENIPFVFITGYGRGGIDARWADRPVLQKPFRLSSLERALRDVLGSG